MRARYISGVLLCLAQLMTQAQQGKGTRPAGADVFDDLPVAEAAKSSVLAPGEDAARKIRENIFVQGRFDRPTCYAGEQVLLTYRLYTALESNSTVLEKPGLDGWIGKERKIFDRNATTEVRNGKQYRIFTVWEMALIPLQAGSLSVDPLAVDNVVGYTDAAGKTGQYSGTVRSNRPDIRVLPLPSSGKPAGFPGAIGKWVVKCRFASTELQAGDMDTLWVTVSGRGSFDILPPPGIQWPAGLRALPAFEEWNLVAGHFPDSGSKTTALSFTATKSGDYIVPAVALQYFDPRSRAYATAWGDPVVIKVKGTARAAVLPGSKPIWPWWAGLLLLVMGGAGMLWRRRLVKRREEQALRLAEEQAKSDRERHWMGAVAGVEGIADDQAYLVGVKQVVTNWLRERLKAGNVKEEELLRLLRARDAAGAAVVGSMLERCNTLLYAPGAMGPGERQALQQRMSALVAQDKSAVIQ